MSSEDEILCVCVCVRVPVCLSVHHLYKKLVSFCISIIAKSSFPKAYSLM